MAANSPSEILIIIVMDSPLPPCISYYDKWLSEKKIRGRYNHMIMFPRIVC